MRLALAACVAVALLGACQFLPERVRDTPELSGRVTRGGVALQGATVSVHELDDAATGAPDCRSWRHTTTTAEDGRFTLSARSSLSPRRDSLATLALASQPRFYVCVRASDTATYDVVFRGPAQQWDTLEVDCDLARAWLTRDRHGVEGRCTTLHMGVDGQRLAVRQASSPALTCDTSATLIEPLRLGPVRINGSLSELRRLCPALRDSLVEEEGLIGTTREFASVLEMGGEPVLIYRTSGVIHRIVVKSSRFRTADSLGVGVRVRRLLDKPDLHVVVSGNYQGPYTFAWHGNECGLGYSLSRPTYDMRDRVGVTIPPERLRVWPETTSIRRVVIGFCPAREMTEGRHH